MFKIICEFREVKTFLNFFLTICVHVSMRD
nr:MAG TPA: hypothetical protein [Caudoviricetes sp.]